MINLLISIIKMKILFCAILFLCSIIIVDTFNEIKHDGIDEWSDEYMQYIQESVDQVGSVFKYVVEMARKGSIWFDDALGLSTELANLSASFFPPLAFVSSSLDIMSLFTARKNT